jgi:hypothetical protein
MKVERHGIQVPYGCIRANPFFRICWLSCDLADIIFSYCCALAILLLHPFTWKPPTSDGDTVTNSQSDEA